MSEKKATGYKAQSSVTIDRNKRIKAERHAKRMNAQMSRDPLYEDNQPKVPRGTARNLRRKVLQVTYAKRMAQAAA